MSHDPSYVERLDRQVWFQPYALNDVTFNAFMVPARRMNLQALVDRFLNEPAQGAAHYEVFADFVLLYFANLRRSSSKSAEFANCGWVEELESGIWIPVVRTGRPCGSLKPVRQLCIFPYYTFMNSSRGMSNAREVYGLYKELANVTVPSDPGATFRVSPFLFDREGPSDIGQAAQLFQLAPVAATAGVCRSVENLILEALYAGYATLDGAIELLKDGVVYGPLSILSILRELLLLRPPFVFLKQYRDASDPRLAAYQAIVEAEFRVEKIRKVSVISTLYTLQIQKSFSHPLVEELGLSGPMISPLRGFTIDMDFQFDNGRALYENGGMSGPAPRRDDTTCGRR